MTITMSEDKIRAGALYLCQVMARSHNGSPLTEWDAGCQCDECVENWVRGLQAFWQDTQDCSKNNHCSDS
jgi:hypothetical protein